MNYDISSSILLDYTYDDFDEWSSIWLKVKSEPEPEPELETETETNSELNSLVSYQVFQLIQQSMHYILSKSPVLSYKGIWKPNIIHLEYDEGHWIVQMFFVTMSFALLCEKLASQYAKSHNISDEAKVYDFFFSKAKESVEQFVKTGCPF